ALADGCSWPWVIDRGVPPLPIDPREPLLKRGAPPPRRTPPVVSSHQRPVVLRTHAWSSRLSVHFAMCGPSRLAPPSVTSHGFGESTAAVAGASGKRMPPSGEDYLYPAKFFMRVDLPQPLRSALRRAG